MLRTRLLLALFLVTFSSYSVLADVRSEQKTQVQFAGMLGRMMNLFGGKAAREYGKNAPCDEDLLPVHAPLPLALAFSAPLTKLMAFQGRK